MMLARRLGLASIAVALFGCSSSPAPRDERLVAGFDPPPAAGGYTRYIMPAIARIPPGTEAMWCQWVAPPFDHDTDVLDVVGHQSVGGHHAILYATTIHAKVGTTRPCLDQDLTTVRFLGGIGGEGATNGEKLPEGVVYRIPKGSALMANVHYVNYTRAPIDGQAVLDLQLTAIDKSRSVASLYTNIDVNHIWIPAGQHASLDVTCTMREDMSFFWFGNHMHALGESAFTELIHPDGARSFVRQDDTWSAEARFNPSFNRWSIADPLVVRAGDRLHTQCHWNNTTSEDAAFPREMCVGFGFFVGAGVQINCIENDWGV
jgi:copper type II ascorbate-dependent monooxygenase-like protein